MGIVKSITLCCWSFRRLSRSRLLILRMDWLRGYIIFPRWLTLMTNLTSTKPPNPTCPCIFKWTLDSAKRSSLFCRCTLAILSVGWWALKTRQQVNLKGWSGRYMARPWKTIFAWLYKSLLSCWAIWNSKSLRMRCHSKNSTSQVFKTWVKRMISRWHWLGWSIGFLT